MRDTPENHNKPWDEPDLHELYDQCKNNYSIEAIADYLGRTPKAIERKIEECEYNKLCFWKGELMNMEEYCKNAADDINMLNKLNMEIKDKALNYKKEIEKLKSQIGTQAKALGTLHNSNNKYKREIDELNEAYVTKAKDSATLLISKEEKLQHAKYFLKMIIADIDNELD